MRAGSRFTGECLSALRAAIADAGGNEVFALGWLDGDGLVSRVETAARGGEAAVPALDASRGSPGFDADARPDVYIHNHPSGFLTPSDNDLLIAARAAGEGTGSFIVDNAVTEVYAVAEPVKRRARVMLDAAGILAALEEGGAVARRLQAYEPRQAQLDLMRLLIRGFNEDALVAAEAGTGVGKSFAYLLPAVNFALANNERVVISTATITLQQQLFEKDIPLVRQALGADIKAVLVKGRGNYLCLRRLADALGEGALDPEEAAGLKTIAGWAETTASGSRSDLGFLPPEGLWARVCSDADMCMGMRCPERERCFVMLVRKEAAAAGLLVVNHHLLFADLAARREGAGYEGTVVLPPYRRVILDEAHTIEDAATSFFSSEMSRPGINRQLARLYRRKRASRQGLLVRLAGFLPASAAASFFGGPEAGEEGDRVWGVFKKIRAASDALDAAALELCAGSGVFRLIPAREEVIRKMLSPHFAALRAHIAALGGLIRDMLDEGGGEGESGLGERGEDEEQGRSPQAWGGQQAGREKDPNYGNAAWEVKSVLRRLERAAAVCGAFLEYKEKENDVLWIERRVSRRAGAGDWAAFTVTPVDIAPALKESLFEPNRTVACLSATLTAAGSFGYWAERSGFALASGRQRHSAVFPSPFPYERSALLAVPTDAPLPGEDGFGVFVNHAAAALAEAAGGSALILFTSYDALLSAWQEARPVLETAGIRVLKQGDDDRHRLLSAFLEDESSVLFATDSFWEGVDAPGDTLRLVILCRLPFRSPGEPVFEARCEKRERAGGNAFMELSLPEAVTKFKQGFGRLMRRSTDHGVIAVLDARIIKKRYGSVFLDSLPPVKTCFSEFPAILRAAEGFLFP
ncbi:MAG: ATP-dependent DNA helicase DinG [Treponematales bacterium]